MKITRWITPMMEENIYLIEEEKHLSVIDPGGLTEKLIEYIDDKDLKLEYILLTHGHHDHIAAVNLLKEKYQPKIVCHKEEEGLLLDPRKNLSSLIGEEISVVADVLVDEGDQIEFGEKIFEFIHTPGHTAGSMCIAFGNDLFSGDMLFKGAIGRTDLPTANPKKMEESILKLKAIKEDYKVYPGHGEKTHLFYELANNFFFQ